MDVDNEQAQIIVLTENLAGQNLTPMEEARAYATHVGLLQEFETPWTENPVMNEISSIDAKGQGSALHGIREYAAKIGVDRTTIRQRVNLLWLPPEAQTKIDNETLWTSSEISVDNGI